MNGNNNDNDNDNGNDYAGDDSTRKEAQMRRSIVCGVVKFVR